MAVISALKEGYLHVMRQTYQFDVSGFVPSDRRRFLASAIFHPKWTFKYLKRLGLFWLLGQGFLEKQSIERRQGVRLRVLWLNFAAPSLGDSLMDLSPRVLLEQVDVDLLTDTKNVVLYEHDAWFERVTADIDEAIKWHARNPYDLIIMDSYSPRVLIRKVRIAPLTPFVGIYGFVNGFEIHRTYFAFGRLAFLLRATVDVKKCPVMSLPPVSLKTCPDQYIALAVGGEWQFRTYSRWSEVISASEDMLWVLVGSENGVDTATSLSAQFKNVTSHVGQLGLMETACIIKNSRLFVGCDGGLWHIACALEVPSVVLFADVSIFDNHGHRCLRGTDDMDVDALYSEFEVSTIDPLLIAGRVQSKYQLGA